MLPERINFELYLKKINSAIKIVERFCGQDGFRLDLHHRWLIKSLILFLVFVIPMFRALGTYVESLFLFTLMPSIE